MKQYRAKLGKINSIFLEMSYTAYLERDVAIRLFKEYQTKEQHDNIELTNEWLNKLNVLIKFTDDTVETIDKLLEQFDIDYLQQDKSISLFSEKSE